MLATSDDLRRLATEVRTLTEARFTSCGEATVAGALTSDGDVLTGIWIDAAVDSAALCAATGPICEAHRRGVAVVASLCMQRERGDSSIRVLPACGICQERLAVWGRGVLIAVDSPDSHDPIFETLRELRPHYWNQSSGTNLRDDPTTDSADPP